MRSPDDDEGLIVTGTGGNDTIDGGSGDDVGLTGDSLGIFFVSMDGGDDTITGGSGNDAFLIGDSGVFSSRGTVVTTRSVAARETTAPIIGDHDPVCGIPPGSSGNDSLFGDDGDDDLHGDIHIDSGNPAFDSGSGNDTCNGNAGVDTATFCETVTGVP